MEKQKDRAGAAPHTPVSFPRWREILRTEFTDPVKLKGVEQDIFGYLKFLKGAGRRASVETVLDYLHELEEKGIRTDSVRSALRWFFKSAAVQADTARSLSVVPAATERIIAVERPDDGVSAWEKRLVAAIRRRHLQWRTEQTYRGWARRFAVWLEGRSVEEAGGR